MIKLSCHNYGNNKDISFTLLLNALRFIQGEKRFHRNSSCQAVVKNFLKKL